MTCPARGFRNKRSMKIQRKTDSIVGAIEEIAEPLCLAEGFELVHVECVSDSVGIIIRIYIDNMAGVTLDDCVYMSRQLGDLIDVQLENISAYRLEISSPGPKRPLKKIADFERFKGRRVKVETVEPIGGRLKFTGVLDKIQDGCIEVVVNKETVVFRLDQISKSRLA